MEQHSRVGDRPRCYRSTHAENQVATSSIACGCVTSAMWVPARSSSRGAEGPGQVLKNSGAAVLLERDMGDAGGTLAKTGDPRG